MTSRGSPTTGTPQDGEDGERKALKITRRHLLKMGAMAGAGLAFVSQGIRLWALIG